MKMKGKDIVKELILRKDNYMGPGEFSIIDEAKKFLSEKFVTIKYPSGTKITGPVRFVTASDHYCGLFAVLIGDQFLNIFDNTEVILES